MQIYLYQKPGIEGHAIQWKKTKDKIQKTKDKRANTDLQTTTQKTNSKSYPYMCLKHHRKYIVSFLFILSKNNFHDCIDQIILLFVAIE